MATSRPLRVERVADLHATCSTLSPLECILHRGSGRTSFSCFSFLAAMYTLPPFCTYAAAIIVPIPDPPPVTTAVSERSFSEVHRARAR